MAPKRRTEPEVSLWTKRSSIGLGCGRNRFRLGAEREASIRGRCSFSIMISDLGLWPMNRILVPPLAQRVYQSPDKRHSRKLARFQISVENKEWLLKNSLLRNRKNRIASGSSISDFSQSPGHFLSPHFRLFSEKPTFSTATRIYQQLPDRKTATVPTWFPITRLIGDFLYLGCDNSVFQLANTYGFVGDANSTTALLPGMEFSLGIERCFSSSKAEPGPRSLNLLKIKGTPSDSRSEFPSVT